MTTRREFLAGLAAVSLGGSACVRYPFPPPRRGKLPDPAHSGLDQIVVLCMENRSFDHYLGWVPGSTGRQAGLSYLDELGTAHPTHHLTSFTGCGFNDPSHSYNGGRIQLNGGAIDGFRRGSNDDFALGYYEREDLAVTSQLVDQFTVCDHWFASILAPTYPNRFYTHSAATDRISNTLVASTMPTIWDRLGDAGVPARYYYSDLPVLALYGSTYLPLANPLDQFFADAAAGTLPSYSYVDPAFFGDAQNDDHPHADLRRGQNLIGRVVEALVQSPQWSSTLLIITYDEWGGFFDTVVPPRFPDLVSNPGGDASNPDHGQAGFRVPTILVSPFSQRGRVARTTFDHSAILKLVEWRWRLPSLTPRDAASNNIAHVLDFKHPRRHRPEIVVPPDPGPDPCGAGLRSAGPSSGGDDEGSTWDEFMTSPLLKGWDLGG
jgi:phospholipase C